MYNSKGDLVAGWEQCFGDPEGTRLYEQFPPRKFDWINDKLNFYRDSNLVLDHEGKEINSFYYLNKYNYVIIAFWAEYMGKFSKNMLIDLENYIKKHSDKKIVLLKVNFGNPWEKNKNQIR